MDCEKEAFSKSAISSQLATDVDLRAATGKRARKLKLKADS
jgi:hypothetical protein